MIKCKGKWTAKQLEDAIIKHGALGTAARALGLAPSTMRCFINSFGVMPKLPKPGAHSNKPTLKKQVDSFKKPIAGGELKNPESKRQTLNGKRFVFTSAQNNTHLNTKFWSSLKHFCKHKGAQLYVSRFTYNKSGFQNAVKDSEGLWYDPAIEAHVLDSSAQVAGGLVFSGELDILPTAQDPLSGFDSYAGYNSAIIPHAKVAMKSLPRLKGELPRFLYTTGTVTQRNYIQRKAGQKAEFHHVYGALYVEVDKNGYWFARQLIADNNGVFYDLTEKFTPEGVKSGGVEAVTWGDIHIEKSDPAVAAASWGMANSILYALKPKFQFVHDLTDFTARNHHEIANPYSMAKKHVNREEKVTAGLQQSADFLEIISRIGKVIVVESNHHEAFERWLRTADGHRDPANAEFWHLANAQIFKSINAHDEDFDVYEWALKKYRSLKNVQFLKSDESYILCGVGKSANGIECGIHGHRGINGARGQNSAFRSIGKRVNVGHTHSAAILDGVYCAGVSGKLDMGYNVGLSSWSNSHIITYENGKRAIITIKNGRWHG